MGDYSCQFEGIQLNLHKHCESGKSQSQQKITVLRCTFSSPVEDVCFFDSGLGESELPSASTLRGLNNTSVCMTCCDGFCYLPLEIPSSNNAEEFHGYIASAVISFIFTLLVVLFGVLAYRVIKRRRESAIAKRDNLYDIILPPSTQEQPSPAPRESPSLEMEDLSIKENTRAASRPLPLRQQTAADKCISCGQCVSSQILSERRTSASSVEADSERSVLSHPRRNCGRSIKRTRVGYPGATPPHCDRGDSQDVAPPLPPRRGSSASSTVGSVSRDERDSERLENETQPCVVLLGLEPSLYISSLVRDLQNSERKKRNRTTSGSLSRKTSSRRFSRPSHRSSSMF